MDIKDLSTPLTLVILVFQAFIAYRQSKISETQKEIAQREYISTHRPKLWSGTSILTPHTKLELPSALDLTTSILERPTPRLNASRHTYFALDETMCPLKIVR